jgi:tetratricopeptide (TPR) repeat protein
VQLVTSNHRFIILTLSLQLVIQGVASADCKDSTSCPESTQLEELAQALQGYREAVGLDDFGEAEVLAKRVVELSIALNGRESVYSANALTNLAYVQYRQENFETSRLNLRAAINTIEGIDGNLSADLIRSLHRLGQIELALGEVDTATSMFQRAVHISHVHNGPQNTDQIESLEAIAEIYLSSNNVKEARNIQRSILAYRERSVDPESAEYLAALQHYADWMHKLQLYNRERGTYRRILEIQEDSRGQNDLSLIPTLIRLAHSLHDVSFSNLDDNSFRFEKPPDHYLSRAMSIAADHLHSDWELFAQTALTVGDYYTVARRFVRAKSAYDAAWQQMSIEPARIAKRREEMELPMRLTAPLLPEFYEDEKPLYEPANSENFLRGTIIAEFDVSRMGESVNIKVVDSQPPGLTKVEARLVRALRSTMHRPRLKDGSRVDTQQLNYVYEFAYRVSDGQY